MTKILLLFSCLFLTRTVNTESVYTYSITSIEGDNKPLSAYEGKKMLIVTLPVVQNTANDAVLHSLDSLSAVYSSSVVIVAAPSYEDGYAAANKNSLKTWYRSILGSGIIITNGMYTRRSSGSQQHPLFQWLTDKNKNEHFNRDIDGPWNKFIVWPDGKLVGVLAAQTRLGSHTVNTLLQ